MDPENLIVDRNSENIMGNEPLVSIVVATHNSGKYLEACLGSLISQTYENIQIIVVDDGSNDETGAILKRTADQDSRIKVIKNPRNRGIAYSRNRGIYSSDGAYIAVLDADDEAYPQRIEKQIRALRKDAELYGVGSEFKYIDEDGKDISISKPPVAPVVSPDGLLKDPMSLIHGTFTARRDCFTATGGYREEFERAVDYDLLLRMSENFRLGNIVEPLVKVRVSLTSGTFKYRSMQVEYSRLAQELAVARRETSSDPLDREDKKAFNEIKKRLVTRRSPVSRSALSSNYSYWAHRMYHRGPVGFARKLAAESLRYSPFNFYSWGLLIFLSLPEGARRFFSGMKRMIIR
jgi:glycosyltransferase involved in cell wall biosynthesis